MTRVAVHTDRWRLGLTIVLLWPGHLLYYISNDHQCRHLTMHMCEEHACATNQRHHQTLRSQRKHISSSLPLSSPSLQLTAHLGLIVQQQSVCVLQQHGAIGKTAHCREKKQNKRNNHSSLQTVRIFSARM